jgi:chemosensory pili system protein ChpA (sensor histidine kinase/response regulator)
MMGGLPSEDAVPQAYEETLFRVRELDAAIPKGSYDTVPSAEIFEGEASTDTAGNSQEDCFEEQVEQVESTAAVEAPAEGDYYADCDGELLDIFLEEGVENLETSDSSLHRWRESPDDVEALAALRRALHTLKGGARMADLVEIGDVAHAAETLILGIVEGQTDAGEAALDGVQRAHDVLAVMLDSVRNRQPVDSAQDLVDSLDKLCHKSPPLQESDAPVLDEPAAVASADEVDIEEPPVSAADDPYAEADQELLEVFLEEAADILEHSEQTLQNWKHAPEDAAMMAEFQRELHTLKGGARMADITAIGDLAHAVESLMVKAGESGFTVGEDVFTVLEQAQDALASMVEHVRGREAITDAAELVENLERLRDGKTVKQSAVRKKPEIKAVPVAIAEQTEKEDRRKHARSNQELVRVKAGLLDNMVNYAGEVSIYRSRLEQQVGAYRFNLVEMDQTVSRVRDQLRKLEIETEAQVLYRYEREEEVIDEVDGGIRAGNEDFDPLEMDRYSHMQQLSRSLVESVSDLGSIQNLLESITRESETLLLQQSRVNTELQEGLMRTRMVPFLGLAARMRRIVRQTAQELGKKAELELSGAEGEMDRTVVDRIVAPIEHMLRNAISHGIELPDQRTASGKPEAGTIRITLERESSDVVLRIADDGAGISMDAVRSKAIERGLMPADSELSDHEILQFILETGFSTAVKVTQVAGRGVGMDVVSNEVKQLGGSLQIDSDCGKGTTFTIRLPFTLALNQALLIEVGEDTYAIPLSSIEGIVRMRREDLKAHYDDPSSHFEYGGFAYEVRHLGTVLGSGRPHIDSGPKRVPVLLARVGEHCMAFHVENLIGSREIVVKSVGPQISTVRGVSGATILGDGRVVMILDLAALLRGGASVLDQVGDIIQQPVRTEGLTVMVVDDSITVRKVTTRLLERNEMTVITAKDGVDAVSKLQEHIPDIMLLDIEMPRMDGFELATHVRNEERLRGIPIIMITSRTGDKHRQRAMQIGVNRYLGKPFQESDLLENIRALLEER